MNELQVSLTALLAGGRTSANTTHGDMASRHSFGRDPMLNEGVGRRALCANVTEAQRRIRRQQDSGRPPNDDAGRRMWHVKSRPSEDAVATLQQDQVSNTDATTSNRENVHTM